MDKGYKLLLKNPLKNVRPALLYKRAGLSLTGFSLLEVLVSIVIVALSVTGTVGIFIACTEFQRESELISRSIHYGVSVDETLKVYVSEDPNIPAGAGDILSGAPADNPHEPDNIAELDLPLPVDVADCEYTVTDNISGTDLKRVIITVTYHEP